MVIHECIIIRRRSYEKTTLDAPCAAMLALLMSVMLPVEAWAAMQGQTAAPEKETALAEVLPATTTGTEVSYVDDKGATQTAPNATAVTANDTVWQAGMW